MIEDYPIHAYLVMGLNKKNYLDFTDNFVLAEGFLTLKADIKIVTF